LVTILFATIFGYFSIKEVGSLDFR